MNEQYNILFEWAENNRNTFEPLYRKDARRHYNETPFSADLLADFIVEVQSLLKRVGYEVATSTLVDRANARLKELGQYFSFTWIDENSWNHGVNCVPTPQQRRFASQVIQELREAILDELVEIAQENDMGY